MRKGTNGIFTGKTRGVNWTMVVRVKRTRVTEKRWGHSG